MVIALVRGVYRIGTLRGTAILTFAALFVGSLARAQAAPDPQVAARKKASGLLTQRSMLNEKQQRRVLTRCDRLAVTFYLSEPGEFLRGTDEQTEDFRDAGRYAARKMLASQLEALKPEVLEQWREYAVGLRSREKHEGEVDASEKPGGFDLDVGLRSGRPFVGTSLAKTRLTFEWDWRHDSSKLSLTRNLAGVSSRAEVRYEESEPEYRISFGIPVSW